MKKEESFHEQSVEAVLKKLSSSANGLTEKETKQRRLKHGLNEIKEKDSFSIPLVILRQFKSLMVYILIAAAVISFFLERKIDAYVIIGIIFSNVVIGYLQEAKAEKAIKALKKMVVLKTKVYRSGELIQIPAKYLVPGDVIFLEEGDKIPADARLIEIKNFRTVESSLTGESLPIDKYLKQFPEKTSIADRRNMVWLGTFVASGQAKAIVVATGSGTTIGKLAQTIKSIEHRRSHFQEKSDILAKYMAIIAVVGAFAIFVGGFFIQKLPVSEILIFTLASLVSGIPEGLPAILATVLAIGAYRMAKKNAIIRNRYATETLSVVDTIITDKTGTLTQNTMTIKEIILAGQKTISVDGNGWVPKGNFYQSGKQIIPLENEHLEKLIHIAAYCNNAQIKETELKDKEGKETRYEIIGDPTEAALVVLAEKAGVKKRVLYGKEKKLDELPFNPSLKYRASLSIMSEQNGVKQIYVVGAPEAVLKNSTYVLKNGRKAKLTEDDAKKLAEQTDSMTSKAMRTLAMAYKEIKTDAREISEKETEGLIFVGIVGMSDPPREGVKEAISKAKTAGIRVLMATGDHKNTAISIAKEIGLVSSNDNAVLTGAELSAMSDSEFERAIKNVSVFARLTPEMKLKIVKTLQKKGKVVAVTGDGVNDAPALKQADIGISMGLIGTDVARESSEVILADDNFASIVNAIEEGRTVFINTRQTSFFLVTTGLAEHITIVSTIFLGMPLPLLPTQILWLNIITGGVTDVAVSTEQVHHEVLKEKPRDKKENILTKEITPFLILMTAIMLVMTILVFRTYLPYGEEKARTAAFIILSLTQVFNMFNMRSLKNSVFKIGFFKNRFVIGAFALSLAILISLLYIPYLKVLFGFVGVSLAELFYFFALSSIVLWSGEGYKFLRRLGMKRAK
ncbi:HAD-IC family P-type ATPase [Candidatus Pacearchaeota archaeon]|nr:HAD-IC family P-type ATPase [Candidatus Pacearchaeota archaeon]